MFRRHRKKLILALLALPLLVLLGAIHIVDFRLDPAEVARRFAAAGQRGEPIAVAWRDGELGGMAAGPRAAPAVLFIHGTPGGWDNALDPMLDPELAHLRRVAYDRPGFGGSTGLGVVTDLASQADAAAAVVHATLEPPVVAVGHSYGGPVAIQLALDHPELVRGVVLVAASVDPDQERVAWYQAFPRWSATRWLVPGDLARANDELLPLEDELRRQAPRWGELQVPVAVVHGEADSLVPVANVDFVTARVPATRRRVWREAEMGHFVPWSDPELIVEAIRWVRDPGDRAANGED